MIRSVGRIPRIASALALALVLAVVPHVNALAVDCATLATATDERVLVLSRSTSPAAPEQIQSLKFTSSNQIVLTTNTSSYEAAIQATGGSDVLAYVRTTSSCVTLLSSMSFDSAQANSPQAGLTTLYEDNGDSNSDAEILLTNPSQVQTVTTTGSGDLFILAKVLAGSDGTRSNSAVSLKSYGPGDIFVSSPLDTFAMAALAVETIGSGDIQLDLGAVDMNQLDVKTSGSGSITTFTSTGSTSSVSAFTNIAIRGSGDLCMDVNALSTPQLTVQVAGSGDLSVVSQGQCQSESVTGIGSGDLFLGGLRCDTVNARSLGSGDIVVQAVKSLTGLSFSSGSVQYMGPQPAQVADRMSFPGSKSKPFAKASSKTSLGHCSRDPKAGSVPKLFKTPVVIGRSAFDNSPVAVVPSMITTPSPVFTAPSTAPWSPPPLPSMITTPSPAFNAPSTAPSTPVSSEPQSTLASEAPSAPSAYDSTLRVANDVWQQVKDHQQMLVPLGVLALLAIIFLWRMNSQDDEEEHERNPLLGAQAPVYI